MEEYRAMYKCRFCGQVYENGTVTGNRDLAIRELIYMSLGEDSPKIQGPLMLDTHFCDGERGPIGLADFQGWRKSDE